MYANLGPEVAYHRSLKTCDWSSVSLERAVVTVCHDFQVSFLTHWVAFSTTWFTSVAFHSWISLTIAKKF